MKTIFILACFLLPSFLFAQSNQVEFFGTLKDSVSNKIIESGTVTLVASHQNRQLGRTIVNQMGQFKIRSVVNLGETFELSISSLGYVSKLIQLKPENNEVDLGTIVLISQSTQLQSIVVNSKKQIIRQEIDRISYDVHSDPEAKTQSIMELLKKVPLISVDAEDNIQLQGGANFKIFINGKPSGILSNNPKDVLKSMSANTIQRIEVITTPPAKYDAEGLAGIINFITIKKSVNGYNGNFTYRFSDPISHSAGFSGVGKFGRLATSITTNFTNQPIRAIETVNRRVTYGNTGGSLYQSGPQRNEQNNFVGGFEISYEQDSLHLATASISYNNNRGKQVFDRESSFSDYSGQVKQYYRSNLDGLLHDNNFEAYANYQIGNKRIKDEHLTFSYKYAKAVNDQNSITEFIEREMYGLPDFAQQNRSGYRENTFQVDLVRPIRKFTLEAGVKAILRSNYSLASGQVSDAISGKYLDDTSRHSNLDYQQNIFSIYYSYQLRLNKWNIQAGWRGELTFVNAGLSIQGQGFQTHYFNLIPNFAISRELKNRNSIGFGMSHRLVRPGIVQLNPFVDKSNPELISIGNPYLRPVVSHLYELTYSHQGKNPFTTKIGYYYINNNIESVINVLADTLSISTFDNVGKNSILRTSFNGVYSLSNKWNLSINTLLFYVWVKGVYNGKYYSNQGPTTNTSTVLSYKPSSSFVFSLTGGYNRRYIRIQGGSNDYPYYFLSGTYNKDKFTLNMYLTNPFSKFYSFTLFSDTPDFYQSLTRDLYYRYINLGLTYRIGRSGNVLKRSRTGIVNDDAVVNSN